jgi:Ca2+/Na+ antiporter
VIYNNSQQAKRTKHLIKNLVFYFLLIILIIYIISPWDVHPHFFDDLGAFGLLYYVWHKYKKYKRAGSYYYSKTQSQENKKKEPYVDLG